MSKILIISYTFPPNASIGGRRWAKFSKYFQRFGHEISVFTSDLNTGTSPWQKDIKPYQEKISYLPTGYPKYLGIIPNSIKEKVLYRLSLYYSKFIQKGNFYDKGAFWEASLSKLVIQKIAEGYTTIIVTVAPFRVAYSISKLIPNYPQVQFIVDFRDPWTNNKTAYGFDNMSLSRKEFEEKAEQQVIERFNKVVSVSEVMNQYFIEKYKVNKNKFFAIPNGFDKEDIQIDPQQSKFDQTAWNLVFTGTFYNEARYQLELLKQALDALKQEDSTSYLKLHFHFYGACYFDTSFITQQHANVTFYGLVPIHTIYACIQQSTACLLFLTDDINYSFSTKFCEYIALQKPVIVFSKEGETGKFVETHKIGFSVDVNHFDTSFKKMINLLKTNELSFNTGFNTDNFDVEVLAKKYLDIIS